MANEDKITLLDEMPVIRDGITKFARTYAGPSDATKPKDNLANGSFYIKTDIMELTTFDEVTNKWSDEV